MKLLIIFIILFSMVKASDYSDLEYIKTLINKQQYTKAYSLLDNLVSKKYIPSYIIAGRLLENGLGTKQNCSAALLLYTNAAKENYCLAFKELARTALTSKCTNKKHSEIADKFYKKYELCENRNLIPIKN